MPSGFTSETISLGRLLADPFGFRIPDYQRPYSWRTDEAEQLLDDLFLELALIEDGTAKDSGYFLGAVLLMELPGADNASGTLRLYDIVDGQQRLVTITILLAVIRDLAADDGEAWASTATPHIWTERKTGMEPRIQLRGRDGSFLRTYVQEARASSVMPVDDELTVGMTHILSVRAHLANAILDHSIDELKRLVSYLLNSCFFSLITTRSVDRAHRIFSVLNERGRPLARNDILKAQILGGIASERQIGRAHV